MHANPIITIPQSGNVVLDSTGYFPVQVEAGEDAAVEAVAYTGSSPGGSGAPLSGSGGVFTGSIQGYLGTFYIEATATYQDGMDPVVRSTTVGPFVGVAS